MKVKQDRHTRKIAVDEFGYGYDFNKFELISMVDFSARIPNISQNILLILEVAFETCRAYYDKKFKTSLNERPGLHRITYAAAFDNCNN